MKHILNDPFLTIDFLQWKLARAIKAGNLKVEDVEKVLGKGNPRTPEMSRGSNQKTEKGLFRAHQ